MELNYFLILQCVCISEVGLYHTVRDLNPLYPPREPAYDALKDDTRWLIRGVRLAP